MISIRWYCEECGEDRYLGHEKFATVEQITLDILKDHGERSKYCESQTIYVGMPLILLDPARGYTIRQGNGYSTEKLPVEGDE